jgi:hypothetical protein
MAPFFMQRLSDTSALQAILQHGINRGLWTLDALDKPPPNYTREINEARKSEYFGPDFTPTPYRNLLRAHAAPEAVQPTNPRDFDVAAATRANEGQSNLDLLPQQWPPVPGERDQLDQQGDQDSGADGADHGDQGNLAAAWEHLSPGLRDDGEQPLEPVPTVTTSLLGW